MNLKISYVLVALLFVLGCTKNELPKNYIIEIPEFIQLSKKEGVKIIDFRKIEAYNSGHVKNALPIWRSDIEDQSLPYGGMKASKKQLEDLFSQLGIKSSDTLLVYDDKGLCDAARFWWVLQYYGFTKVKLVNGGLKSIIAAKIPLTTQRNSVTTTRFLFKSEINTTLIASKEQVVKAIQNNQIIIDTRTVDEYNGNVLKKGAYVKGKIPNSQLIDWASAINYEGDNKIKDTQELEKIYRQIAPSKKDTIFVYCHSGVRSAHTTFVLTQLLGYKHVLNYDGSWTEWSYFKNKLNK